MGEHVSLYLYLHIAVLLISVSHVMGRPLLLILEYRFLENSVQTASPSDCSDLAT